MPKTSKQGAAANFSRPAGGINSLPAGGSSSMPTPAPTINLPEAPAFRPEAQPMNTQFGPFTVGNQTFGGSGSDNTVPQSPGTSPSINPNDGIPGVAPITNTPSTSNYNAGSFFNMPRTSTDIMSMLSEWLPKIMGGMPGGNKNGMFYR